MKQEMEANKFKKRYLIFLVLFIIWLIDTGTRITFGMGLVGLVLGYPFLIFGEEVFATVGATVGATMTLIPGAFFIIPAFIYYRKWKKSLKNTVTI